MRGGGPHAGRPRTPTTGSTSGRRCEMRAVGDSRPGGRLPNDEHPAQARLWIRISGTLDDDVLTHQAAFTYASDLTLLGSSLVPHGVPIGSPNVQSASLDHTIWFHRPFRADEWLLYDQVSPSASRCPRPGARPGVHRGRPAGRHGGPGGPDPARAELPRITAVSLAHPSRSSVTDTPKRVKVERFWGSRGCCDSCDPCGSTAFGRRPDAPAPPVRRRLLATARLTAVLARRAARRGVRRAHRPAPTSRCRSPAATSGPARAAPATARARCRSTGTGPTTSGADDGGGARAW